MRRLLGRTAQCVAVGASHNSHPRSTKLNGILSEGQHPIRGGANFLCRQNLEKEKRLDDLERQRTELEARKLKLSVNPHLLLDIIKFRIVSKLAISIDPWGYAWPWPQCSYVHCLLRRRLPMAWLDSFAKRN